MAEPAFYRCKGCSAAWQRNEWRTRQNPPPRCPHCRSTDQEVDQPREDAYLQEVYGPITRHIGQLLGTKLEEKRGSAMKIYIVVREPYHDHSTLLGAYLTIEAAERSVPDTPGDHGTTWEGLPRGRWSREGCYVNGNRARTHVVSQRPGLKGTTDPQAQDDHLIYALDFQDTKEIP